MCQIFMESDAHTKSHQSVSTPPPPNPAPAPSSRSVISFHLASRSKQLSLLIGSICVTKMKLWLDSEWKVSVCAAPVEPWTWNLNNIYSQRSLSRYSKHAHCWKMRWAGRFQDDPGLILALGLLYVDGACWVSSRSSSFLPQSKNLNIRLNGV